MPRPQHTLALLGHPVAHSLSPRLMAVLSRLTGHRVLYRACDVSPDKLAFAVGLLRSAGFLGGNITIPHKTAVVPLLDRLTPQARLAGAVNVVRRDGQRLVGHNTDLAGFSDALRDAGFRARGRDALIFGAGGAARAAVAALGRMGARRITVTSHRPTAARTLTRDFSALFPRTQFQAGPACAADLAINATPLGLPSFPDRSPAPPDWRGCDFALDMIYGRRTAFQRQALRLGARTAGGTGMLVCQALRCWEFWFGPLEETRRAFLKNRLIANLLSARPRCA
jgi:shikimate dehydrogenase